MSKYAVARDLLGELEQRADAASLRRQDVVEALMTLCVQDMKEGRGKDYTATWLQYELSSLGAGGVFDIAKR